MVAMMTKRCHIPAVLTAIACLAAFLPNGAAIAAPIVLYDPGAASPATPGAALESTTTAGAPQPCGLSTPCTDLNTAANATLSKPFLGGMEYGMSGFASAGVSNVGQGGAIGVLGWVKPTEDTTLSVGVSVGASRWNGQKYTIVR
jgi:hypothetical protein